MNAYEIARAEATRVVEAAYHKAVAAGELTMTAAQNNFDIGYKAVETMVKILKGEQYDKVVDTGTEIITQDNAEERLTKFNEWMK